MNFTPHPYHWEWKGGRRGVGERNDEVYHSDGVAVLLLAEHHALFALILILRLLGDTDRDTSAMYLTHIKLHHTPQIT